MAGRTGYVPPELEGRRAGSREMEGVEAMPRSGTEQGRKKTRALTMKQDARQHSLIISVVKWKYHLR